MNYKPLVTLASEIQKSIEMSIESHAATFPNGLPAGVLFGALAIVSARTIRTVEPSDDEAAMLLVKRLGEHIADLVPVAAGYPVVEVVCPQNDTKTTE